MSEEIIIRAEQTLRDLEQKRVKLSARAEQISEARKALGYSAFAEGNKAAKQKLAELNGEANTLAGELEAITAAITEASARVVAAKASESRAADETKARALLELADAFDAEVDKLAEAADGLVAACTAIGVLHTKAYSLGAQRPIRKQLDIMLGRVIVTALMKAGLQAQTGVEFLAPGDRKSADVMKQYADVIRTDAQTRLGETEKKAA